MPQISNAHPVTSPAFTPLRTYTILRLPEVLRARGRSRSSHFSDIKAGLFTPSVKLGVHCSGWPEYEVIALNQARISGKTDEEIRELVAHLIASRSETSAHLV